MAQSHSLDLEASSSQYASIVDGSQTGLDLTGDHTIEIWAKLESAPATDTSRAFVSKTSASDGAYTFSYVDAAGVNALRLTLYDDGTPGSGVVYEVNHTLTLSAWCHLAVTWVASTGTATFYVNGRSIGTDVDTAVNVINNSAGAVFVGAVFGSGYQDGLLKDVRIFDDVRSAAEILADAHTENVTNANLQAEWNLNNAYTDSSGNSNTLTASGSPVFSTNIPWEGATAIDGSTYLETNLVSYWNLDEASGTREDSHGANDLTDNNTVLAATGIINDGADFERTNTEYLSIADGSQTGLDLTNDFTFALWAKFESVPASGEEQGFIDKYGDSNNRPYRFQIDNSGGTQRIRLLTTVSAGGSAVISAWLAGTDYTTLSTGVFYHIVVSKRGATAELFIDGISCGVKTAAASQFDGNATFYIGTEAGVETADAVFDEIPLYSRALHYGDVLDLYNAGSGITYAGGVSFSVTDSISLSEANSNLRARLFTTSDSVTMSETISFEKLWNNITKSVSSWTNSNKPESSWDNKDKPSTSWTNETK